MGNCCQSKSIVYPDLNIIQEYNDKDEKCSLPKVIVTSEDVALIYLDISQTEISKRYRNSLKRKFPTLITFDNDKVMLKHIELMEQRKFYIIIVKNIRKETMKDLIQNSKVKSIYFCLDQFDLSIYPKSSKIKGIFNKQIDLKRTIFKHIRRN
jgi:hypothetical protein